MKTQNKNMAWILPRPRPDYYRGGMPLYAERWLLGLAKDILLKAHPRVLNLFCGRSRYGFRVDVRPLVEPDLLADAHDFVKYLPDDNKEFDVILADPPYSDEEAAMLYGTPKLRYFEWTAEADKVLVPGGLFIIYHKLLVPNPNPKKYRVEKRVFIAGRVWHLPRIAVYFRKRGARKKCQQLNLIE